MNEPLKLIAPLVLLVAVACSSNRGNFNEPAGAGQSSGVPYVGGTQLLRTLVVPSCVGSRQGRAQCDVLVHVGVNATTISGWQPANLEAAYSLPSSTKGSGQIVAVVDAYDNPDVATDLAKYRSTFGLPAANFGKYNQTGHQRNYPTGNTGWGREIDLDVEMVSASCPNCTIYLVEANSDYFQDLDTAEAEAVKLGSHIVSNSYGGEGDKESYYDTPGVTYLASSGDNGYGISDPASFASVVAVGGTVLSQSGSTYSEVAWPDTGGGCTAHERKPSWQHDSGCSFRTANDVAAVAEDVAAYDTYGEAGWMLVDGTSISSPLLAGVYGLAGNATKQDGGGAFWTLHKKKRDKDLHFISSGNDGSCSPTYLCTDGTGEYKTYGGPTGWGTPNGIGAF